MEHQAYTYIVVALCGLKGTASGDGGGASTYVVAALVGYLSGAIPFGVLVARAKGVDITTCGSGNVGATNVGRVLGPWMGRAVLLLDILKGLLPTLAFLWYYGLTEHGLRPAVFAGFFAIAGHIASPFLLFRGGKGVATTVGVFGALLKGWVVLPLAAWLILAKLTRYVSVGSLAMAACLPLAAWMQWKLAGTADGEWVVGLGVLVAAVVIFRHRGNIRRLLQGQEHRYGEREAEASDKRNASGNDEPGVAQGDGAEGPPAGPVSEASTEDA